MSKMMKGNLAVSLENDQTIIPFQQVDRTMKNLTLSHMAVGYIAVAIGTLCGLLQVLVRSENFQLPKFLNYYQILTAHGVLLALVFTTFFIFGFFIVGMAKTLGHTAPLPKKTLWVGFYVTVIGSVLATLMIILNKASVMYTFYAPLKASPWFYIGLSLFVVGTWIEAFALLYQYFSWKRKNPKAITPLFSYMTVTVLILWIVCCLGVVSTVLFQLIPWSFGWVDTINVALSRTLFWYFGHPLVYFWLLPAYMVWYTMLPKILGGKLFSDTLARFAFILFLLFSTPVGLHHQLVEPGVSDFWKFLQTILTFMVIVPSLMTAFSMFAIFENRGRELGGKGILGWIKTLPWHDIRFTSIFVAMLFFIPGGAGGIVNASFQINEVIHNTLWVVGHFHITVGTPVVMTFFAVSFWLIPHLTGRKFTDRAKLLSKIQIGMWAIGMLLMSTAQHILGLFGAPRRTAYSDYGGHPDAMEWFTGFIASYKTMAVGGAILFFASFLFLGLMIYLWCFAPKVTEEKDAVLFPMVDTPKTGVPAILENWKFWILLVFMLIFIAYTIPVLELIRNAPPGSFGFKTW